MIPYSGWPEIETVHHAFEREVARHEERAERLLGSGPSCSLLSYAPPSRLRRVP